MGFIELKTAADLPTLISQNKRVILKFSRKGCSACEKVKDPVIKKSAQYDRLTIIDIDDEKFKEIGDQYKVTNLPTFIPLYKGQPAPGLSPVISSSMDKIEFLFLQMNSSSSRSVAYQSEKGSKKKKK